MDSLYLPIMDNKIIISPGFFLFLYLDSSIPPPPFPFHIQTKHNHSEHYTIILKYQNINLFSISKETPRTKVRLQLKCNLCHQTLMLLKMKKSVFKLTSKYPLKMEVH